MPLALIRAYSASPLCCPCIDGTCTPRQRGTLGDCVRGRQARTAGFRSVGIDRRRTLCAKRREGHGLDGNFAGGSRRAVRSRADDPLFERVQLIQVRLHARIVW